MLTLKAKDSTFAAVGNLLTAASLPNWGRTIPNSLDPAIDMLRLVLIMEDVTWGSH
jgi:hypothetical protein